MTDKDDLFTEELRSLSEAQLREMVWEYRATAKEANEVSEGLSRAMDKLHEQVDESMADAKESGELARSCLTQSKAFRESNKKLIERNDQLFIALDEIMNRYRELKRAVLAQVCCGPPPDEKVNTWPDQDIVDAVKQLKRERERIGALGLLSPAKLEIDPLGNVGGERYVFDDDEWVEVDTPDFTTLLDALLAEEAEAKAHADEAMKMVEVDPDAEDNDGGE